MVGGQGTVGQLTFERWKDLMTMAARSCWSVRVTVRSAMVTELPTRSGSTGGTRPEGRGVGRGGMTGRGGDGVGRHWEVVTSGCEVVRECE